MARRDGAALTTWIWLAALAAGASRAVSAGDGPAAGLGETGHAIAAIERVSGMVELDRERVGAPPIRVMLGNPRTGNDDLAAVAALPTVETLVVAPCEVTDAGLRHIEG